MSKRDTIVAAVLVNVIVLGILFMFARNTSDDRSKNQVEMSYTLEDAPALTSQPMPIEIASTPAIPLQAPQDEVDDVLNSYTQTSVEVPLQNELPAPVMTSVATPVALVNEPKASNIIDVTVKKGDALEKIARAYGTTVDEIKRLNNLTSEKLNIGQILHVQANKTPSVAPKPVTKPVATATSTTASGAVYYTIKSGDNPWKIARQCKVRYEDILALNNLNEDKARNLKVGDKIRVK